MFIGDLAQLSPVKEDVSLIFLENEHEFNMYNDKLNIVNSNE